MVVWIGAGVRIAQSLGLQSSDKASIFRCVLPQSARMFDRKAEDLFRQLSARHVPSIGRIHLFLQQRARQSTLVDFVRV